MNNYIKYGLILIASIYVITVLERVLNKDTAPTEMLIEHATEKAQMQTKIDLLNTKVHGYEVQLLKIRTDVDNLTNDEVDSVWATIFD
jgi:hypothetical protein